MGKKNGLSLFFVIFFLGMLFTMLYSIATDGPSEIAFYLFFMPFYPLGLLNVIFRFFHIETGANYTLLNALGWFLYIIVFANSYIITHSNAKPISYKILLILFIIMILLNIVGCEPLIKSVMNIH